MNWAWRVTTCCGVGLGLLGLSRTWGHAQGADAKRPTPSPARVMLEVRPDGEGKTLRLEADSLTNGNREIRAQGNVVLYAGGIRFHVPRAAVRIVPEGEQGYRDVFVEPQTEPAAVRH
jgi:hypothetical protein